MRGNILLLLLATATLAPPAALGGPKKMAPPAWLEKERPFAIRKIFDHSAQPGLPVGSVIASPSRSDPDYYYHWVRDAALTMDTLVTLYSQEQNPAAKRAYLERLLAYADFSVRNQSAPTLTGLGEPKFHADGTPFHGPWGRPQNDGPALRAATFSRLAAQLLAEGDAGLVRRKLYDGTPGSLIKTDLEYVSHHWRDASFDLWEEVLGDHFYTRMVQRRALLLGARLARALDDGGAADWYERQAGAIARELEKFWDPAAGYVRATLGPRGGLGYKASNLDVAVVLGALHGGMGDGFFDWNDERIRKTAERLAHAFRSLYGINARKGAPGVAIGRYPEDRYGGGDFNGGNPWVLATLAFAELRYRAAESAEDVAAGDTFVARVVYHANGDGTLSEQMQRDTGFMCSAENLTWNYAAVLTTWDARRSASARAAGGRRSTR